MKKANKFIFYISHDIETGIGIADNILFIRQDGKIVVGTHNELYKEQLEYQELVNRGIAK